MSAGDDKPGADPVPRRRDPRRQDPARRDLGEPPGRAAVDAAREQQRQERELERLDKDLEEVESFRMPLMDHLVELKNRVLWALLATGIGVLISANFANEIYGFLIAPMVRAISETPGIRGNIEIVGSPFEGVFVWLRVTLLAGVALASPVISWQVWQFIAPGLYRTERRIVLPLSMASVALFFSGAAFCYYGIFPYAFPFFLEVLGLDATISADGYLSAVLRMMLAFGACFQLPVGAFFLARMGAIDARDMAGGFRYAVVVIFVLAALITPPDPLTQGLLAIPMVLLYGVGIIIAWMASTKQREEQGG